MYSLYRKLTNLKHLLDWLHWEAQKKVVSIRDIRYLLSTWVQFLEWPCSAGGNPNFNLLCQVKSQTHLTYFNETDDYFSYFAIYFVKFYDFRYSTVDLDLNYDCQIQCLAVGANHTFRGRILLSVLKPKCLQISCSYVLEHGGVLGTTMSSL